MPKPWKHLLFRACIFVAKRLDVDAPCGGYNLHWAWSSGLLAGLSIARDLNLLKRKTPPVPFESADARRKDDSFATDPAWRIAASALERESGMIDVSGLKLSLDAGLTDGQALALREIARQLGVKPGAIERAQLLKRSVDARKKANVHFTASYRLELSSRVRRALAYASRTKRCKAERLADQASHSLCAA